MDTKCHQSHQSVHRCCASCTIYLHIQVGHLYRLSFHASIMATIYKRHSMQCLNTSQLGVSMTDAHVRAQGCMSYSPSSSSNSPSSSAVAFWYCWYSETRAFMLDSASVNSISSIPSPVYQ